MACTLFAKRLILMSFLLMAGLLSNLPMASAQSFDAGYRAFKSGKYKKASSYLQRSLKKTSDPYDLAFTYKILGVCLYKTGKKKDAFRSFQQAVKYDPKMELSSSEARDPGIQRMFANAKVSKKRQSPRQMRRGRRSRSMSRNMSRRQMVKQTSSTDQILVFAPFGVGQFRQNKTLLGGLFAAGQVGALVSAIMFDAEFKDNDKVTKEIANDYDSGNANISTEEFEAFLDDAERYGNERQDYLNYSLIAFVGLYGASVVEGLLNPPKTFEPRKRRPKRRRRFGENKTSSPQGQVEEIYTAVHKIEPGPKLAFYSNFNVKRPKAILGLDLHF